MRAKSLNKFNARHVSQFDQFPDATFDIGRDSDAGFLFMDRAQFFLGGSPVLCFLLCWFFIIKLLKKNNFFFFEV